MTKSKLKQRLSDLSASNLQIDWDNDSYGDYSFENLCTFMRAIKNVFLLKEDHQILAYWNINEYEIPSNMLDFIHRNLK